MPRSRDFAKVQLAQLTDRKWNALFPERCRVYLYLVIQSRGGRRDVRFSNEMAAEIGLIRQSKQRALRWLEKAGLVEVQCLQSQVSVVRVAMPS
jgi:hypothetical protein